MPTYRMTLEYEGTRYHGWQEQKNARSVSGELRRAIEEAGGTVRELGGSGRTDAGVHALAQVAHLRLARQVDPEPFRRAVNDRLPPDVHILSLAAAADRFHSRHDAVSRSYLYQISRRRTALAKRFVWWVKRPLDEGRMAEAAALLEGRHDFRLFCERPGRADEHTGGRREDRGGHRRGADPGAPLRLPLPLEDGPPGGRDARAARRRGARPAGVRIPAGREGAEVGQGIAGGMDGAAFRIVPGASIV